MIEQDVKNILGTKSIEQLVEGFENSYRDIWDKSVKAASEDTRIQTVRGWYMDELKSRNNTAFIKWVESEEESPRKFYL